MAENVFKYSPVTKWNGMIVDFDMPSTDGDVRLTEICLVADSCLEASKDAINLSYVMRPEFDKARSSPVQAIIRTLFGADTDIEIITYPLILDGVYYIMGPQGDMAIDFPDKDLAIDVVNNNMNIAIEMTVREIFTEVGRWLWDGTFYGSGIMSPNSPILQYAYQNRHVPNPYWEPYYGSGTPGDPYQFFDSGLRWNDQGEWEDPAKPWASWDFYGVPWIEVKWEPITQQHCSDGSYGSDIWICEATVANGYCRQTNHQEPLIISNRYTARCSNNDHKTKIACEEAEYIWTPYEIEYSNKEITFPASDEAYVLQPIKDYQCLGAEPIPQTSVTTVVAVDSQLAAIYGSTSGQSEFLFVDLETASGIVPASATITKVEYRGDLGHTSEYVTLLFPDMSTFDIASSSSGTDTGCWQEETITWQGNKVITSFLTTYQGKTGFFCTYDPTAGVNGGSWDGDYTHGPGCCYDQNTGEELLQFGGNNESGCISWGHTWTWGPPWGIRWTVEVVDAGGYQSLPGWTNGGRCLYTKPEWPLQESGDTDWQQEASFETREMCMEASQNIPAWDDYYLMWIEQTNTWTPVYHHWRPSGNHWHFPGGGPYSDGMGDPADMGQGSAYNRSLGHAFIWGSINSFRNFNILTSPNHREYPKLHTAIYRPQDQGEAEIPIVDTVFRMYADDTNLSWGNFAEVGRSSIPMWLTSSYAWADWDQTYFYCQDMGSYLNPPSWDGVEGTAPVPQFSLPLYDDIALGNPHYGYGCITQGTCDGNNSYDGDEMNCHAFWDCSRYDGDSFRGPPQACQDSGWMLNAYDHINETMGEINTWEQLRQSGTSCYNGPNYPNHSENHIACGTSGKCTNNHNCTSGNYGENGAYYSNWNYPCSGSTPQNCYCYQGRWTTASMCEGSGVCERWWYSYGGYYGVGWRIIWDTPGSHGNKGSNWQSYCEGTLANDLANWCAGYQSNPVGYWGCQQSEVRWFSDNNTWEGYRSGAAEGSGEDYLEWAQFSMTYDWLQSYYMWRKTIPRVDTEMPITYADQSDERRNYINLAFGPHEFVGDEILPSTGSCSSGSNAGQYDCPDEGTCSDATWNNNETDCLLWGQCTANQGTNWPAEATNCIGECFDSGGNSFPNSYNEVGCLAAGDCYGDGLLDADLVANIAAIYMGPAAGGDTSQLFVGQSVSGYGIPAGTTITQIPNSQAAIISNAVSAGVYGVYTLTFSGILNPLLADEQMCLAAGTCTDPMWNDQEEICLAFGTCNGNTMYNDWEQGCFQWNGICSNTNYNDDMEACLGNGETWTATTTWTPTNTWTSAGNTWTSLNYSWTTYYYTANTWISSGSTWIFDSPYFAGEPAEESGYHTNDRPEGALIRWKPPQADLSTLNREYPRPTHFRIYRAPWVSPEGLSFTGSDYEANMWRLAGEVVCNSDSDFHYFTDTKKDLVQQGVGAYDRVYYKITAVWKSFHWKTGYRLHKFGYTGDPVNYPPLYSWNWDKRVGQTWSHWRTNPSGALERLDGECSNTYYSREVDCLKAGLCSWSSLNNNEEECLKHGTCSDPQNNPVDVYNYYYIGPGYYSYNYPHFADRIGCLVAGSCYSPALGELSQYENHPPNCLAEGICEGDSAYDGDKDGCINVGTCSVTDVMNNTITQEWICLLQGNCDLPNYNNSPSGCFQRGVCTVAQTGITLPQYADDEYSCLNNSGYCSDPAHNDDRHGCTSTGICFGFPQWNNDYYYCVDIVKGTWIPDNTWIGYNNWATTGVWTQTGVWTSPNQWISNIWTSADNTWTDANLTFTSYGNSWTPGYWTGDEHANTNPYHSTDNGYSGCWWCQGNPVETDEIACNNSGNTWTSLPYFNKTDCNNNSGQWFELVSFDEIETVSPTGNHSNYDGHTYTSSANQDRFVGRIDPSLSSQWGASYGNTTFQSTFRLSAYFRAPVTGTYQLVLENTDAGYLWLGANGEKIIDIVGWRNYDNFTCANPGDSAGVRIHRKYVQLVEGEMYPLLIYWTRSIASYEDTELHIWIHYPSGEWNDGGEGLDDEGYDAGDWRTVQYELMSSQFSPYPADFASNNYQHSSEGQTVEGHHTNEDGANIQAPDGTPENDIYSFYTD